MAKSAKASVTRPGQFPVLIGVPVRCGALERPKQPVLDMLIMGPKVKFIYLLWFPAADILALGGTAEWDCRENLDWNTVE